MYPETQAMTQLTPPVTRPSEFKNLAGELEKSMCRLREEIFSLNHTFELVLKPERTDSCEVGKNIPEAPRAEIQTWAAEQLQIALLCLERIQSYKERCVL